MFQRAPPEVNGFGVTTWTPGFTRSFQLRIFFGLPSRRTKTTTDRVRMPLDLFEPHVRSTTPPLTSALMSGQSERWTKSAFCPARTARVCSPEAPYDWLNETLLPALVFS